MDLQDKSDEARFHFCLVRNFVIDRTQKLVTTATHCFKKIEPFLRLSTSNYPPLILILTYTIRREESYTTIQVFGNLMNRQKIDE